MRYTKTIASLGAAAVVGTAVIDKQSTEFKTYAYAGYTAHDIWYMARIKGAVEVGKYCYETGDLKDANVGDVVISLRANSAENCRYISPDLPTIAVAGWSNAIEDVGDEPIDHALTISAGASYGKAIDYYIDEDSLSAAMPAMANIINTINQARRDAELPILGLAGIRLVLDGSSDEVHEVDGRYYGQLIDLNEAVRLSTATSTPIKVDWMSGILGLILEGEK